MRQPNIRYQMIKISFLVNENDWLPNDDTERCQATIDDILHHAIGNQHSLIEQAMVDGATTGNDIYKDLEAMYRVKLDILKQMQRNINVKVI